MRTTSVPAAVRITLIQEKVIAEVTARRLTVRGIQEAMSRTPVTGSHRWAGIAHSALKAVGMEALTDPGRTGAAAVTAAVCLITGVPRDSTASRRAEAVMAVRRATATLPLRVAVMDKAVLLTEQAPAAVSTALPVRQTMAAHSATTAALLATGVVLWASRAAPTMVVADPALWVAAISGVGQDPGVADLTAKPAPRATKRTAVRSEALAAAPA